MLIRRDPPFDGTKPLLHRAQVLRPHEAARVAVVLSGTPASAPKCYAPRWDHDPGRARSAPNRLAPHAFDVPAFSTGRSPNKWPHPAFFAQYSHARHVSTE